MRWVKSLISVSSVYIVYMNMSCTLNFLLLLVVHFTSYRFPFRKLNYRIKQFQYLFRFVSSNTISPTRSRTCQHHTEITQSHTFAALIRLSTTTHNLLTFNISEISSENSTYWQVNASGLFSYTRLIQVPGCRVTRSADHLSLVFTPEKNLVGVKSWPGSKFTCNFALT